jgi:hypothetical protein
MPRSSEFSRPFRLYNQTSVRISACSARLNLRDSITVTTLGEEPKSCSLSLRSFLQPPTILYLLGPHIILCNLFPNALRLCPYLNVRNPVHTHNETTRAYN